MFTLDDVKALLNQAGENDVLSLYLNVNNALRENQADNPAWRIELKKALRELADEEHPHWEDIQARATAFFDDYTPSSKGLIAFFGPDWEQTYAVPLDVQNQAAYGEPLISPFVHLLDEYEPYLVVRVDREEASFFVSTLGQTEFHDSMEIDIQAYDFGQKTLMPATGRLPSGEGLTQGSNREAFEDMVDEHRARFYREVADYTQKLMKAEHIRRMIIGGSEEAAHALHKLLPEALRDQVVDVTSLPGHYAPHQIFENLQPQALNYEHEQDLELVEDAINKARAGGRAVLGPEAVRHALDRQQVEQLILTTDDMQIANELSRRALALNSDVEFVDGAAAAKLREAAGGIAARLYYAM